MRRPNINKPACFTRLGFCVLSHTEVSFVCIKQKPRQLPRLDSVCRDDWIRTSDHTPPRRVRYRAALRPDYGDGKVNGFMLIFKTLPPFEGRFEKAVLGCDDLFRFSYFVPWRQCLWYWVFKDMNVLRRHIRLWKQINFIAIFVLSYIHHRYYMAGESGIDQQMAWLDLSEWNYRL